MLANYILTSTFKTSKSQINSKDESRNRVETVYSGYSSSNNSVESSERMHHSIDGECFPAENNEKITKRILDDGQEIQTPFKSEINTSSAYEIVSNLLELTNEKQDLEFQTALSIIVQNDHEALKDDHKHHVTSALENSRPQSAPSETLQTEGFEELHDRSNIRTPVSQERESLLLIDQQVQTTKSNEEENLRHIYQIMKIRKTEISDDHEHFLKQAITSEEFVQLVIDENKQLIPESKKADELK